MKQSTRNPFEEVYIYFYTTSLIFRNINFINLESTVSRMYIIFLVKVIQYRFYYIKLYKQHVKKCTIS